MLRILKFLTTGDWHLHKWVDAGKLVSRYEDEGGLPLKITQPMQCEVCGKRKTFDL